MKLQVLTSVLLVFLVVLPTPSLSYNILKWFSDSEQKNNKTDKPSSTIQLLELNLEKEWAQFKEFFRRGFNSKNDESARKEIFAENLKTILRHNYMYSRGLTSYAMAVNQFTDMTKDEFKTFMVGSGVMNKTNRGSTFLPPANVKTIPEEVDWRKEGYVTPVKNQGSCGSCWAFSSTGAIEGQHFRKTGKLVSLSEQNLVDCSRDFDNKGCNGGLMDQAFEYVKNNSGIDTEKAYPYKGVDQKCHFKKNAVGATVTGFVDVESGNEEQLKQAIATVGPVSVAINAGLESFQHYKHGVFDDESCDPDTLNHGVLAVGYGNENGKDYWLVKNSWSEQWGDKGYIKMVRNKSNQCGIAGAASYPLV